MKDYLLGFLLCGFLLTSSATVYLLGKQEGCVYVADKIQPITLK